MYLLSSVTAVALCIIASESKERTASLVVLPPLVIGYDELYADSETDTTSDTLNKLKAVEDVERNETSIGKRKMQHRDYRDVIVDVQGRRHNDNNTTKMPLEKNNL